MIQYRIKRFTTENINNPEISKPNSKDITEFSRGMESMASSMGNSGKNSLLKK